MAVLFLLPPLEDFSSPSPPSQSTWHEGSSWVLEGRRRTRQTADTPSPSLAVWPPGSSGLAKPATAIGTRSTWRRSRSNSAGRLPATVLRSSSTELVSDLVTRPVLQVQISTFETSRLPALVQPDPLHTRACGLNGPYGGEPPIPRPWFLVPRSPQMGVCM